MKLNLNLNENLTFRDHSSFLTPIVRSFSYVLSPFIAMFLALFVEACGGGFKSRETENRRSSEAELRGQVRLKVEGVLRDEMVTNVPKFNLTTHILVESGASKNLPQVLEGFEENYETQVEIESPTGERLPVYDLASKKVPQNTQKSSSSSWALVLSNSSGSSDGLYTVKIRVKKVGDKNLPFVSVPQDWIGRVQLDTSVPMVSIKASSSLSADTARRSLQAAVWIKNEQSVKCSKAQLASFESSAGSLPLELEEIETQEAKTAYGVPVDAIAFASSGVPIPPELKEPLKFTVDCIDQAQNSVTYIQPVDSPLPDVTFTASTEGEKGPMGPESKQGTYIQPGTLTVNFGLLHSQSGLPLPPEILRDAQGRYQIVITEKEIANVDQLETASPIWTLPYAARTTFPLAGSYLGYRNLFANLLSKDPSSSKRSLIGTVVLPIFVAKDPPVMSWVTDGATKTDSFKLVSPTKTEVKAVFKIAVAGAPLRPQDGIKLEYTTNGVAWSPIVATIKAIGNQQYEAGLTYPFTKEKPFRLRVRTLDYALIEGISSISPQIVGKAPPVAPACTTTGKSNFAVSLASHSLCRKKDAQGVLSAKPYVQLFVKNLGPAKTVFYETSSIPPEMAYRVYVKGTTTDEVLSQVSVGGTSDTGEVVPPPAFDLKSQETKLYLLEYESTWNNKNPIHVDFDRTATEAHSLANFCFDTWPSVIIKDTTKGEDGTLVDVPMPCNDSLL